VVGDRPHGGATSLEAEPAPTLLLVEDDDELRREMAAYLVANGYPVQ